MKFFIESISGKKGYKSFETLEDFTDFMTRKGHLVKELKEADLPYTDKPVKLPKVSKSKGWTEVSNFGEVGEEAEKGESLIASTSKSVMKDEASFEMSKSSGKADKQEMGLGAEKGDIDMSDFKSFEYEEPKLKSSETKESAPKSEEPKSEEKSEPKEDKKESSKKEKSKSKSDESKEDKKDDSEKEHDKDIEECLKAAGITLEEGIKDYLPRAGFIRDNDEDKDSRKMGIWGGQGTDDQLRKAKIIAKVKFANGDRMGRVTKDDLEHFDEYKAQYDEIYGSDESLEEGWKDKLKKGAATLGVAASLAGNAMAHDTMYDGARDPSTNDYTQEYSQSVESDYEAPKMISKKGNMIIDQFGNEWTSDEWKKLSNGVNPYGDGAKNPNIEETLNEDDDSFEVEIAECLRLAGC